MQSNFDKLVVFCHGFGLNSLFWEDMKKYFSNHFCIYTDLGYFPEIKQSSIDSDLELITKIKYDNPNVEIIGIGHSLGMVKLLSLGVEFSKLVGLNCFLNFTGGLENTKKRRVAELKSFTRNFIGNPHKTLQSFLKRAKIQDFELPNLIDFDALISDLKMMKQRYSISNSLPTLALSSKDDRIMPAEIFENNFSALKNVKLELLTKGGHALGMREVRKVADKINFFINTL